MDFIRFQYKLSPLINAVFLLFHIFPKLSNEQYASKTIQKCFTSALTSTSINFHVNDNHNTLHYWNLIILQQQHNIPLVYLDSHTQVLVILYIDLDFPKHYYYDTDR